MARRWRLGARGVARDSELGSIYKRSCLGEGVTTITHVSHGSRHGHREAARRGGVRRHAIGRAARVGAVGLCAWGAWREGSGRGRRCDASGRGPRRADRRTLACLGVRARERNSGGAHGMARGARSGVQAQNSTTYPCLTAIFSRFLN
jgi:hypothetical protein